MILSFSSHHLRSLVLSQTRERPPLSCTSTGCVAPSGRPVLRRPTLLRSKTSGSVEEDDEAEEEEVTPGKPVRVERLLANLGYGKRKECQMMVKKRRVLAKGKPLKVGEKVLHADVTLDGEPLDPGFPFTLLLHKPVDYVVTSPEDKNIAGASTIYDLLPYRFASRRPFLSAIGRLDKDTSGLLMMSDDGQLVHRVNSPRKNIWKVYDVTLQDPLEPKQVQTLTRKFASGFTLVGDTSPLLPAKLTVTSDNTAQVAVCEGRYHQVRRMFATFGHHVVALHRSHVGGLTLEGLDEGEWRPISSEDMDAVFGGPSSEEILGTSGQARAAPAQAA
ncbi:pseudouridine synthase [Dunaliella salina]|uniref:Pseudouridine synthase n=2 Tax=Dunaliella salina TaxID=3046 RepID=A0ABQ7GC18_DUNSA|nr:pseudouridine synthase [Dunaliella salina]|eukprot:KAF5832150.1 pseudouridine synthase [Dunaliella salina]